MGRFTLAAVIYLTSRNEERGRVEETELMSRERVRTIYFINSD